jgi:Ca2+-binding RTX toxin-like protein
MQAQGCGIGPQTESGELLIPRMRDGGEHACMNSPPDGSVLIDNPVPLEGTPLAASYSITDADGTIGSVFTFQWQSATGGGGFHDIAGATGDQFVPTQSEVERVLRVVVSYVDDLGTPESVASAPTELVGDLVMGTPGDDVLSGGAAADLLVGLGGDDTYVIDDWNDRLVEEADAGTDTVRTSLFSYVLDPNVENLAFTGGGDFAGTGNELDNTLSGGDGNDLLVDGPGNDWIDGGRGADVMGGGAGDDTYIVDDEGDLVVEFPGDGIDTVLTTLRTYVLGAELEKVSYLGNHEFTGAGNELANEMNGGTLNDSLAGGAGDDVVMGNSGNDVLIGGSGNDTLDGGTGNDTMYGNAGDDTFFVDSAGDLVNELPDQGIDSVLTTLKTCWLNSTVENLTFIGSGNFIGTGNALTNVITGGAGGDMLIGNGGDDVLIGNVGNDTLAGGAGNDAMSGGAGNDTYQVDSAGDSVTELANEGTDTVQTVLNAYTLAANVENLQFTGTGSFAGGGNGLANDMRGGAGNDTLIGADGNDMLVGNAGDDILLGGAGNDSLQGGDGADRLTGGGGNDVMNGGAGNDTFVFGAGFGADTIQDFDANPAGGQDQMDLSALGITAANFAARVTIAGSVNTLVVVAGHGSISLVSVAPTDVTAADFLLAP